MEETTKREDYHKNTRSDLITVFQWQRKDKLQDYSDRKSTQSKVKDTKHYQNIQYVTQNAVYQAKGIKSNRIIRFSRSTFQDGDTQQTSARVGMIKGMIKVPFLPITPWGLALKVALNLSQLPPPSHVLTDSHLIWGHSLQTL